MSLSLVAGTVLAPWKAGAQIISAVEVAIQAEQVPSVPRFQVEPSIAVTPRTPQPVWLAAWMDGAHTPLLGDPWTDVTVGFMVSLDGQDWTGPPWLVERPGSGAINPPPWAPNNPSECPGPPTTDAFNPLSDKVDAFCAAGGNGHLYLTAMARLQQQAAASVVFLRSTDAAATWEGRVLCPSVDRIRDKPIVAADPDPNSPWVYVFWFRNTGGIPDHSIIELMRSADGGATFDPTVYEAVNLVSAGTLFPGKAVVDATGRIYLAYLRTAGAPGIYVVRSDDHGVTWSAPVQVSPPAFNPLEIAEPWSNMRNHHSLPSIAVDPRADCFAPNACAPTVYVVYATEFADDDPNTADSFEDDPDVVLQRSIDGGVSWEPPVIVHPDATTRFDPNNPDLSLPTRQFDPAVAVNDNGIVGVIWQDTREDLFDPGDPDSGQHDHPTHNVEFATYFNYSTDYGVTFQPASLRVTAQGQISQSNPDADPTAPEVVKREYNDMTARADTFYSAHYSLASWNGDNIVEAGDVKVGVIQVLGLANCDSSCTLEGTCCAADFDKDCDVDVADFAHFSACVSGSGIPCTQGCCDADLDGDGDVDLADFSAFTACFNGSNGSGQDTWYDGRTLPEHMYEILCEICRDRGIECPGEQR